ncbi:hypothetical protein KQH49_08775 [Mycetohabitans sp. B5]|uniref:Uncharacterized protein n=2 Tax=Mycetohabitans endofungorum TaxID=417203 RepID=A0A2P5K731_9BURK|nr:hypothetical protein [Mycetohabitans sp. B5]MCG1055041.1 hypothetical protein [Mycetohabitans sp. B5]PPB81903.1 hypothetical protein B0O95_11819 [Mycetohabitans endofungorum]
MRANNTARPLVQPTQSVKALKERFSAGKVPAQQDYYDLITLASTAYALVGGDGSKPGAGLALDEHNALSLQLSTAEGEGGLTVEANGVGVALDPASGLRFNEGQLGIEPTHLLSVESFSSLSQDELRQIYWLLAKAGLRHS